MGSEHAQLQPIPPQILAVRRLANAHPAVLECYGADPTKHSSLGLVTCSQDDATYVALDEATKHAAVDVVFARSFYAGSAHAASPLSGEIMGVIAGRDPDEVDEGLRSLIHCLEVKARLYAADRAGQVMMFAHTIGSLGTYLSARAGLAVGASLAYLAAPPIEAGIALDHALKNASVVPARIFPPPRETNFAAAWLTGTQDACAAASAAFRDAVVDVCNRPREL